MLDAILALAAAYVIGSIPVAYIVGRATRGIDIREHGSGNIGASNVYQSVSKILVAPVGLAQIAQGLGAVLIARALGAGDGIEAASGIAAVVANNWNPWLRFQGGRGIGASIGVLLALSPAALAVFIVLALTGVAAKAIPQGVAIGLALSPLGAFVAGDGRAAIITAVVLAALALAKRLLANGPPDASIGRPAVWSYRLIYDRDVRDRDAWVRRSAPHNAARSDAGAPPITRG